LLAPSRRDRRAGECLLLMEELKSQLRDPTYFRF